MESDSWERGLTRVQLKPPTRRQKLLEHDRADVAKALTTDGIVAHTGEFRLDLNAANISVCCATKCGRFRAARVTARVVTAREIRRAFGARVGRAWDRRKSGVREERSEGIGTTQ